MKWFRGKQPYKKSPSSPSRGTWIEIEAVYTLLSADEESSPSRGTWIEIRQHTRKSGRITSSPSRGTWIEIHIEEYRKQKGEVVPLTGDVD